MTEEKQPKQPWLKLYSIILIANLVYIIAFYLITKSY
jgi:hypothetical protein